MPVYSGSLDVDCWREQLAFSYQLSAGLVGAAELKPPKRMARILLRHAPLGT
jgi:hypothetical protein